MAFALIEAMTAEALDTSTRGEYFDVVTSATSISGSSPNKYFNVDNNDYLRRNLNANYKSCVIGANISVTANPTSSGNYTYANLLLTNTAISNFVGMQLYSDKLRIDINGTYYDFAYTFNINTFYTVEVGVVIDSSAGRVEALVDGVNLGEQTSLNTGSFDINDFWIYGPSISTSMDTHVKRFYILGSTSVESSFPFFEDFDCAIIRPTSDSATMNATPSTGSSGYAVIDDALPATTDYLSETTDNEASYFGFENVPTGKAYHGLCIYTYADKDEAGYVGIETSIDSNSTISTDSSADVLLQGDPKTFSHGYLVDPDTGSAFTESALNALEIGFVLDKP